MEGLPASVAEQLQALTYGERAVAYLQVDAELNLVGAGGHLEAYGLAGLRLGEPVAEQVFFLEGLLPPVETPYIVPSMELASGHAADLYFLPQDDTWWVVLLDVSAAREAARRMQQKAYDMTLAQEREALLNRRLMRRSLQRSANWKPHAMRSPVPMIRCRHRLPSSPLGTRLSKNGLPRSLWK